MKKYLIFGLSFLFSLPIAGAARAAVAAEENARKAADRDFIAELSGLSNRVIALSSARKLLEKGTKAGLAAELAALKAKEPYKKYDCAESYAPRECAALLQLINRLPESAAEPAARGGAGASVAFSSAGEAGKVSAAADFKNAVANFEERINGWKEKQPVEPHIKRGLYLLLDDLLHYYAQTFPLLGDTIEQKRGELTGLIDTVAVIETVPDETVPREAAAGGAGVCVRVGPRPALKVAVKEVNFTEEEDESGAIKMYAEPSSREIELSKERKARRAEAKATREAREKYIDRNPDILFRERIMREAQAQAERDCLAVEAAIARDEVVAAAAGKPVKYRARKNPCFFFPSGRLVPGYYGEVARELIEADRRQAQEKITAWMDRKIKNKLPAVQARLRAGSTATRSGGGEGVAGVAAGAGDVMRSSSDGALASSLMSGTTRKTAAAVSGGDVLHKRAASPRE